MAIEKQECSRSDDDFSLVFQTLTPLGSPYSTDAIIIIDDDEDETLVSRNKKTNYLNSNSLVPSTNEVILINDDEEDETLEPTKKKPRLGSSWDNVDALDELSCVFKGLPTLHSRFSSTNLPQTKEDKRSLSSSHHENLLGYSDSVTSNNKENQDRLGYGHVSFADLSILVENPSLGGYVKDIVTPVDSCFPSSSTGLLETKTNTNKGYESQLSSSNHHGDNFTYFGEGGESTNSSNKGIRHVSLEELGVSVEDLKSMPWEAFDPTWEIRSVTMDPWLGGYVSGMFSAH